MIGNYYYLLQSFGCMMMMNLGYCRNSQSYSVVADVVVAVAEVAPAGDGAVAVVAVADADALAMFDVVLAGWRDFAMDSCTDRWAPYYCGSLGVVAAVRTHSVANCLHSADQCPFDGTDAFACNRFDLIVAVAIYMNSACTVVAADMRAHCDLNAYFALATTKLAIADE